MKRAAVMCSYTGCCIWNGRWWDALMLDGRKAKLISVFVGGRPDSLYSPDVRALALPKSNLELFVTGAYDG